MIISPKQNIGEILVEQGVITKEQLDEVASLAGDSTDLEEIIILREKIVTEEEIKKALEKHFNKKYIDLSKLKIDSGVLKIIPEKVMKDYIVVAFEVQEDMLYLAMIDPGDLPTLDFLQILTGYKIKPFVSTETQINKVIDDYYASEGVQNILDEIRVEKGDGIDFTKMEEEKALKEKPIVKLVDTILEQAVLKRVSDIHVEPQEKVLLIRYRKDGILRTVQFFQKFFQAPIISRIKIISRMDIAEKRLPQDGQFRKIVGRRELDFRVSSLSGKYGEKIVIRVLDRSSFAMGLEALGLSPRMQSDLEDIVKSPMGTFLVVGPTGSGKTTTLYSTLSYIRSPEINIITFEDPIEYELLSGSTREGGITQVQVHPKIGLTFVEGLRAALRQDPDVIFVGEIRDRETATMAATASLTGHLVLSSVHTLDTVTTITRLLDLGVEPFLLSATLLGVLTQRLVRKLCNECKQSYTIPAKLMKEIEVPPDQDNLTLYRPKGCRICGKSGYRGRIGVFEMLQIDEEMRRMIYGKRSEIDLRKFALEHGMKTLKSNGMELVYNGVTSVGEVLRVLPIEYE